MYKNDLGFPMKLTLFHSHREAENTTRGRGSPVVRNLTLPFTAATSLGASSFGTPPWGADSISQPKEIEDNCRLGMSANPGKLGKQLEAGT
jgi:hypothetical protein